MRCHPWKVVIVAALASTPATAQRPPDSLVNTQVYPRSTLVRHVIDDMAAITRALGVRCTHCHVGDETMDLWDYDFASDEKVAKRKAREMMRMVNAINGDFLGRLADLDAEGVTVTCMTCHRGVRIPQPLSDILVRAHVDAGMTGLDSVYAALRARYYGQASYDFGQLTLDRVAEVLFGRGARDDAVRIYRQNSELFSSSAFARRRLAGALLETGDTVGAIAAYRDAVRVDPRDGQSQRALERLGAMP